MSVAQHLLIVEDDDDLRTLLVHTFERLGYDVLSVADGAAALRAVAGHEIRVAVIDMMLPGASGFQVLQAVKAGGRAKAVIISGHGATAHQEYAAVLGADGFLVKPFALADLTRLVADLIPDRPLEHDSAEHSPLPG